MLDVFRSAAKGWTAKILIGILAVSFGIWGIADVFRGYSTAALATVGSQKISSRDYTDAFRQAQQTYSRQTGQNLTPEQARLIGIDRQILGDLMRQAALDEQASRLDLAVSDAQIARDVAANPSFLDTQGKFDAAGFREVLARNGLNEQTFFVLERRRLLREALSGGTDAGFVAPDALVEAIHRHQNEQCDARYFVVTAAQGEIAAPSDSEIKDFYEKHPASYTAPEYRSIAVVKVEPEDIALGQQVTAEELKAGYEKYKQDYHSAETRTVLQIAFPTLDDARKARERIAAGADFLDIARDRGLTEADATLAQNAPEASIIDPVIAEAAFGLAEGAISDPIEGKLATALLKVTAVNPEQQKTLDEVKPDLVKRLQIEEAKEQIQSIYDAVEDARAAQTPFEEIAKTSRLPFVLIAAVDEEGRAPDGKDVDLPHKAEVLKAGFASDPGVENDALNPEDGYVWYEVRSVTPSAVKPLESVKDKVKADLITERLRALAADKASKLVERARSGASLESLAQEAGAEVRSVQGLKRNETSGDFDAPAVSALFAVPEDGFAFAAEAGGRSAKVMQSQKVLLEPFDPRSSEAEQIRKAMTQRMSDDILASYLTALQQQAGSTLNEGLWRQIAGLPNP